MKTIEITVDSEGRTQVETKGFTGDSCREASRFLETALGKAVAERLTPEFYLSKAAQHQTARQA